MVVLLVASGLLVASIALIPWIGRGPAHRVDSGIRGVGIAGQGRVGDLGQARQAAQRFADGWGLTVGEVMQFSNGYYAELAEPSGALATEVLVAPATGSVQLEFGPAMMWNTAYGMHRAGVAKASVSAEQAQAIAGRWLAANRPGEGAGSAEAFPGYYTLHSLASGRIAGMLSVNAASGAVWYHAWHGKFVAMSEAS